MTADRGANNTADSMRLLGSIAQHYTACAMWAEAALAERNNNVPKGQAVA
jgi:hypothetical protein